MEADSGLRIPDSFLTYSLQPTAFPWSEENRPRKNPAINHGSITNCAEQPSTKYSDSSPETIVIEYVPAAE